MAILYKLSKASVQYTRLGGNMATYTKTLNVKCFYQLAVVGKMPFLVQLSPSSGVLLLWAWLVLSSVAHFHWLRLFVCSGCGGWAL